MRYCHLYWDVDTGEVWLHGVRGKGVQLEMKTSTVEHGTQSNEKECSWEGCTNEGTVERADFQRGKYLCREHDEELEQLAECYLRFPFGQGKEAREAFLEAVRKSGL